MVVSGSLTDGYLAWSSTDAAAFWSFVQVRREQIDNPAPAAILQGWRSARSPLEQSWQVGDAVDDRVGLGLGARLGAVPLAAGDQHRGAPTARPRPSASSGAVKNSGDGLPSTRAVWPVAYSSSRTHPPVSRCSPSSRTAIRLTWVATSSAPARRAWKAASRSS